NARNSSPHGAKRNAGSCGTRILLSLHPGYPKAFLPILDGRMIVQNRQSSIAMQNSVPVSDDSHHKTSSRRAAAGRAKAGRALVVAASLAFALVVLVQILYASGAITTGFSDWRPILAAYLLWALAFGIGQVLSRGERGQRALFLLPAVFFTVAVVIFPTIFRIYIC